MTGRFAQRLALLCAAVVLPACSADEYAEGTAVRLDVRYEESWSLSDLSVSAHEMDERVDATHELLLALPDAWAGEELQVTLDGYRAEERYAHGEVTVTPVLGTEVRATVTLTRLPCGAWCTEGATQCEGDGVVVCEQRDDDTCMEWSEVIACPVDAPYCSLGTCDAECFDECAEGETRCDGPGGVRLCGEGDTDPCLDWLPAIACGEGETCSGGSCAARCHDACEVDAVRCAGAGTAVCGDLNLDGCTEWGPVSTCPSGQSCSGGICEPIETCSDECEASTCDGLTFTRCGNYDLDPCTEPSPGTSCVPTDPCFEGRCTPGGCETSPRVCTEPPASECIDTDTLRVYDTSGVCESGDCAYSYDDRSCPNCPSCDACAGVTCTTPPSECYEAAGTCDDGSCSYAYDNGAECSDGDACTVDDSCDRGVCSGRDKACDTPPAPTCMGRTLRTYSGPGSCTAGECAYSHADMMCPTTCSGGACVDMCVEGFRPELLAEANPLGIGTSTDGLGGVHVVYYDSSHSDRTVGPYQHAYRAPDGSWTTGEFDRHTGGVSGVSYASIVGDGAGGVHVAYRKYPEQHLWHAFRAPDGSWTRTLVHSTVSAYMSIALDCSGGVHISYVERETWTLRHAHRPDGGPWSTVSVDSPGNIGATSIAADCLGGVHIAYNDFANRDLKYAARLPDGTWSTRVVDSDGDVGRDCSLALDTLGGVHVSYTDWTHMDLKHAYRSPSGTWSSETVDSDGSVGRFTSIALDGSDTVHVAYYEDSPNYDLRYARRPSGGTWSTGAAETEGSVGQFASLAVDDSGTVHVAYRRLSMSGIKYARAESCP